MMSVKIEFAQFGDFDDFSVYRSLEPMTPNTLPNPIASGLKTMFFVDLSAQLHTKYYYRVGVNRGSEQLLGDEQSIETPKALTASIQLRDTYAKREVLNKKIEIVSLDDTAIESVTVLSGVLPQGISLAGDMLTGEFETLGSSSAVLRITDARQRSIDISIGFSVQGEMVLDTQFDSNVDRISGTWVLGNGNSLVSDVTRKNGLKTLRLGNGVNKATAVATFSKVVPQSIMNGDFTITSWIKRTALANASYVFKVGSVSSNTNRNSFALTGRQAQWYRNSNGVNMNLTGSYSGLVDLQNDWIHVAEVRKNNVAYLFVAGELVAQQTLNNSMTQDQTLLLGGLRAGGVMVYTDSLWIDEIKIYQGVGLWTKSFDPLCEW